MELESLDFDLDLLGFSPVELDGMLGDAIFEPVDESEQSQLDGQDVKCPGCGYEFKA